jgi:hypothetical protein
MTPPKDKLWEVAEKKAVELTDWLDDFCGHPLNQQGSIAVRETLRGIIIEGMLAALEAAKLPDERFVARFCTDPAHDDRWCSTCEAMKDGAEGVNLRIDALRGTLENRGEKSE